VKHTVIDRHSQTWSVILLFPNSCITAGFFG